MEWYRLSGQPAYTKNSLFCVVFVLSADLELDEPPVRERNPRACSCIYERIFPTFRCLVCGRATANNVVY